MIPVIATAEPTEFDNEARIPGNAWIAANPSSKKRPPSYWNKFTPTLSKGFNDLCGYAAMIDPTGGTVDHYLSYKNHKSKTYEWTNYRFASATLNSSKKNHDDKILDPYQLSSGWFEILLPSLQMQATATIPLHLREKANFTLEKLKLRDGERIIRWRKSWYDMYKNGELTIEGLRRVAPLIAEAVEKVIAQGGVEP